MTPARHLRPVPVALLAGVILVVSAGVRLPAVTAGTTCCRGGCGCDARGGPDADCCCSAKPKPKRSCCDTPAAAGVVWVPACVARGCRGDGTPVTAPPKLPEAVLASGVRAFEPRPAAFGRPADFVPCHRVRVPPDPPPRAG